MSEEVYYYSKSKNEEIPVSEMSDLYVRRAFKKMILKEKKRFDEKEKIKVFVRNAISNLERALEEKWKNISLLFQKFTVSTSEAHILNIESDNEESAREKFYEMDLSDIRNKTQECWEVDGFPMIIDVEEEKWKNWLKKLSKI